MSQHWKPLPDDLSEPARRLVEELRAVKDAHRISLAELGRLTYLSKASWERWLNGKRLITSQALAGLIAALDCDAVLLASLLRQAEAARDAESAPGAATAVEPTAAAAPAADPVPVPVPVPLPVPVSLPVARVARWRRPRALITVAAVAVLLLVAGLYLHGLNGGGSAAASSSGRSTAPPAVSTGGLPAQLCQSVGCAGKDPQAMGCEADDHTVLTGTIGKVVLYLHYSPRCRAAWAGITDGSPGDSATVSTGTGGQETALIHWGYDNYSMMVDADAPGTILQVCGHQKDGDNCTLPLSGPAARAQALSTTAPGLTPTATPSS
ncbi:DUF2690 domain-containing protein [Kitasatospora sp. NPDC098652]|uniref:DUF2690 domain-containing protein n=1 Tax=Kitasatospora sp. NPDC098652 TaxID=3364095 RepID=UPI0038302988